MEVVALILSVLWLGAAAAFFVLVPGGVAPQGRLIFMTTLQPGNGYSPASSILLAVAQTLLVSV